MNAREVFPNAPLQLVVFEAQYVSDLVPGRDVLEALSAPLGDGAQVHFGVPMLRVADGAEAPEVARFQVVDSAATTAITLWPTSLVIESTDYEHFGGFAAIVAAVFEAFVAGLQPTAIARVGLRYVDELHPDPPALAPTDWAKWVDPRLVNVAAITARPVVGFGGGITIDLGDHCLVGFRFATAPGPAVEAGETLKLRSRPRTPALVLDTDAFWQPPTAEQLAPTALVGLLNRLHDAVRELFDKLITDASRDLFRVTSATPT